MSEEQQYLDSILDQVDTNDSFPEEGEQWGDSDMPEEKQASPPPPYASCLLTPPASPQPSIRKVNMYICGGRKARAPERGSYGAAAFDVFTSHACTLPPNGNQVMIRLGFCVAFPNDLYGVLSSRSGLAITKGVHMTYEPAIIDSDFRGAVTVYMTNTGKVPYYVRAGDPIAQMMIHKKIDVEWDLVEYVHDLSVTERGSGGFGSTDKNKRK